jgi:hypothetical protein
MIKGDGSLTLTLQGGGAAAVSVEWWISDA